MHFHAVSLRVRAKLALRYIPARSYSRVLDTGRARNLAVALHNRGLTVHAILGRDGGRHLRHHHPSRQAVRGQAEITLDGHFYRNSKSCITLYGIDDARYARRVI